MLVVVSYDVANDRRRAIICNRLKDQGERVQFSVFECRLDRAELDALRAELARLISPRTDRVRYYRLCAQCAARIQTSGRRTGP